jgi:hypothetical protein
MIVRESGPSGEERITDSDIHVSCDGVHRRIQVRICDSDDPIVDQMLEWG